MQKISVLGQCYVMFNHCLNFPESNTTYAPPPLKYSKGVLKKYNGLRLNNYFSNLQIRTVSIFFQVLFTLITEDLTNLFPVKCRKLPSRNVFVNNHFNFLPIIQSCIKAVQKHKYISCGTKSYNYLWFINS